MCRYGPGKSTETRQGSKHKRTTLLWNRGGKERQEDYSTFVVYNCVRQQTEWSSCHFFPPLLCSRLVFLGFLPCLVSLLFIGPSLLVANFYRNFLIPSFSCTLPCANFLYLCSSPILNSSLLGALVFPSKHISQIMIFHWW